MKKKKKLDSKEIGLDIGLMLGNYFFRTEHLHYGYWTNDLKLDIHNLPEAQENSSDFVISHIPKGAKTLLDVGSGVGKFALKLINMGYNVDCVSPSPLLTKHTRDILGDKSHIYESNYENLNIDNRYDVILFCESFQYINPEEGIKKTIEWYKNNKSQMPKSK